MPAMDMTVLDGLWNLAVWSMTIWRLMADTDSSVPAMSRPKGWSGQSISSMRESTLLFG